MSVDPHDPRLDDMTAELRITDMESPPLIIVLPTAEEWAKYRDRLRRPWSPPANDRQTGRTGRDRADPDRAADMSDQPDELSAAGDRREALETAHLMIAISRRVGRMTNAQIAELVTAADQILEPLPVPAGEPTYRLLETCIQCRLCGAVSFNADDRQHRYCGRCHLFHEDLAIVRALAGETTSHRCADWRTARGRCAVCHARIPAAPARDQAR